MKSLKQISVTIFLLLVFVGNIKAEKIAVLPELMNPTYLALDDQQLYVSDKETIYIYSLKDFKLKNKFGKAGDGPQEFRLQAGEGAIVFPEKDFLIINSIGKVSFYTKNGVFKSENNVLAQRASLFSKAGNNYVGLSNTMDSKTQSMAFAVCLYDSKFSKIKDLKIIPFMKGGRFHFPMLPPAIGVTGGKIIVPGADNRFLVEILNPDGSKAATISRDYSPLKVSDQYKEKVYETFKTMPATKQAFDQIKAMITFSSEFPPFMTIIPADNLVYIWTYNQKNNLEEFFIYDLKGKLVKQVFLPVYYLYGIRPNAYAIKNNTFYQVVENTDDESWELFGTKIK